MTRKRKRLSQREKDENARIKKELQAEGIRPSDKSRLNRKKFAEEVMKDWDDFISIDLFLCGLYLSRAVTCMVSSEMKKVTPEQVGVLKLLKIAIVIKKFADKSTTQAHTQDTFGEYMERVVLPIIKL